ncbi:MAG TPA: LD-carboxypeptidase [Terriglobales bacterium]|jgi:muramoyltetrapeptide carboxypeptidase
MPAYPPPKRIKPASLVPGDVIGIIAPASNIDREMLAAGCEVLRGLGYKPFYFDSIFEQELYFAGPHERRVREFEEMFERDEVKAIICARGGYGSNYLLQAVDNEKIAKHPKIFAGYSDLTTMLTYISDSCGLVTFHAPMVTKDFALPDGVDLQSWNAAVNGTTSWTVRPDSGARSLVSGSAQGNLYGGCLSILVASLGTPYEIRTEGTILFIEDVATKPYQIDRMLMQLKLAGKLNGVRGIIFGEMLDCMQHKDQGYALEQIVLRLVGNLGIPVAYGMRAGHVSRGNITLPIGVRAELRVDESEVSLNILEAATIAAPVPAHH